MLRLAPLALYVHLPWCERKCPYCDFNSYQSESEPPYAAYAGRLMDDLDADCRWIYQRKIDSIFFGGGTPSLFPAPVIAQILRGIAQRAPLAEGAEITLEANPGSAERNKFRALRRAGVNRLSLGIQSFSDQSLRALGRVHDAADASAAIASAKDAGFTNINLDLMHGLPGQNIGMALADLGRAIASEPQHLSWYQLTVEPNTAFHSAPPRLPHDDVLAEIQDRGEELLSRHGYRQYEVSAWARPGAECAHNLNYWRFGDYLGIGAGAHGKVTDTAAQQVLRTRKTRSPRDYLAADGAALRIVETVGREALALELLLNGLRLREGVSADEFEARTGLPIAGIGEQLARLRAEQLIAADPGRIVTTTSGFRFLNTLLERFT